MHTSFTRERERERERGGGGGRRWREREREVGRVSRRKQQRTDRPSLKDRNAGGS